MDLDRIAVAVRPRNHWEAIDLGFTLARARWRPLYAAWFATALPLALVINVLCIDRLWLAPILLWWLKPLLDRVPLYVLSRAVFGESPGVRDTFKALPALMRTGIVAALTLRRFDMARSFNLPVWQLEGLRGAARRSRMRVLGKNTRYAAVWLTIAGVHLESVVSLSALGLLYLMAPPTVELDLMEWLLSDAPPLWFQGLQSLFHLVTVSIVEPFYVAGGFALYLNRRTLLEGWDIEIAFRRMAQQMGGGEGKRAA